MRKIGVSMKKIFLLTIFIILTVCIQPVYSENIQVMSMSEFSTANPPSKITVKLLEPLETGEETIREGAYVTGELVDVTSPKRLKRDAGFSFKPISNTDEKGNNMPV